MKKHFLISEFFDDPALPLAVHRRMAQRPKELHTHGFSELVLVLGTETNPRLKGLGIKGEIVKF